MILCDQVFVLKWPWYAQFRVTVPVVFIYNIKMIEFLSPVSPLFCIGIILDSQQYIFNGRLHHHFDLHLPGLADIRGLYPARIDLNPVFIFFQTPFIMDLKESGKLDKLYNKWFVDSEWWVKLLPPRK